MSAARLFTGALFFVLTIIFSVTVADAKLKIFIDAGHGGVDLGAKNEDDILEKNIALKLALAIKERLLNNDGRLEITLSRLGDIETLSAIRRVEMSNAYGADLYISIHAAGGVNPVDRPLHIFISADSDNKELGWDSANQKYSADNNELAQKMSKSLSSFYAGKKIEIVATNNLYLGGVNAPAIIVEAIDLADPVTRLRLSTGNYINDLARRLADAIVKSLKP